MRIIRILFRKARSFSKIPLREKLLLVEAFVLCGVFRFTLLFLPFRYLAARLSRGIAASVVSDDNARRREIYKVARTVNTAARYTFWESKCLVRSLTAKVLLRQFGYPNELYLGVRRDEQGGLIAHSWINSCGYNVSGGSNEVNSCYAVVGTFTDTEKN